MWQLCVIYTLITPVMNDLYNWQFGFLSEIQGDFCTPVWVMLVNLVPYYVCIFIYVTLLNWSSSPMGLWDTFICSTTIHLYMIHSVSLCSRGIKPFLCPDPGLNQGPLGLMTDDFAATMAQMVLMTLLWFLLEV